MLLISAKINFYSATFFVPLTFGCPDKIVSGLNKPDGRPNSLHAGKCQHYPLNNVCRQIYWPDGQLD